MPDRLLVVLGLIRLSEKPGEGRGDRFNVGAVVVNLTGIMPEWLRLANRETNRHRRADLGLVQVIAELVGTQDRWNETLKELNMRESRIIRQIEDEAEGRATAKALIQFLDKRYKEVPDDLRTAILAVNNLDQLTPWIELAATARTLRSFRKKAGV